MEKNKKYRIKSGTYKDGIYTLEGKWNELMDGKSWMDNLGNPACLQYHLRVSRDNLPIDNNVYYGHIEPFGHLIHESEIGEEIHEQT